MSWANVRSKLACAALLVSITGVGVVFPTVSAHAASTTSEEQDFVDRLNGLRRSHNLRTLDVDYRLRNTARAWSQQMANDGTISHNPNLASQMPPEWRTGGENVGVGGSVEALHNAFVASEHHYENMINSDFHAVGIGVVNTGSTIWVTVDFMYSGQATPADPEAGMTEAAVTPNWVNYRIVAANGRVFGAKTGVQEQSMGMRLNRPIVGTSVTPTREGQWEVGSDGGVFSFGDANFYGSTGGMRLNQPVVGMAATPTGHGYWLVASDGGIFSFGDANFYGSTGAIRLNQPIVGMASTPSGHGYWLVASDGGIFAFGDANFYGSTGAIRLNQPISGMTATPSGNGYWMVARDGGVFAFGGAGFFGSMAGKNIGGNMMGIAPSMTGSGYIMVSSGGGVFAFGDAPFEGSISYYSQIVGMSR